ncbi:tail fiber domain-containing protein [Filimonas effusa]|nr:tail fiber domain-containing protein [Filimonas effusa]
MERTVLKWGLQRLIQAIILLQCLPVVSNGQVKLGNNTTNRDSSAALEIESDKLTLLLPRINDTNTIVSTVKDGSLIYFNNPGYSFAKGLYVRSDAKWNWMLPRSSAWSTAGNSGVNSGSYFLGTLDALPLVFKTNNTTRMIIDTNGYVGLGAGQPKARLHNQGSTILGPQYFGNFPISDMLGTAASTVDVYSVFIIAQTTGFVNIQIPDPTIRTPGRVIYIVNTGSATIYGTSKTNPGMASPMIWGGSSWRQPFDFLANSTFVDYVYTSSRPNPSLGLGYNASPNVTGDMNIALGVECFSDLTTGYSNVGILRSTIGPSYYGNVVIAPNSSLVGNNRIAIGNRALHNNRGTDNIGIGDYTLNKISGSDSYSQNIAIGHRSLNLNVASVGGGSNSALGYLAAGLWDWNGYSPIGNNIVAIGRGAGISRTSPAFTAVGANALANSPAAALAQNESAALGFSAFNTDSSISTNNGSNPVTKSLAIGALAQVTGSNPAIVLGSARTGYLSNVGIGTYNPQYKVHVNGTVYCSAITTTSDRRLKKDIYPVQNALEKIKGVNGVSYRWQTDLAGKLKLYADSSLHLGFIAQDIEKVLPELVHTASDSMHLKTVAYAEVIPVITEAIKQQQPLINELQQKQVVLKVRLRRLQQELDELENRAGVK